MADKPTEHAAAPYAWCETHQENVYPGASPNDSCALVDWRALNIEQSEQGIQATMDEDGNPFRSRRELDLSAMDQAFQMKVLRFMEAVSEGNPAAVALIEEHERMIADGTN